MAKQNNNKKSNNSICDEEAVGTLDDLLDEMGIKKEVNAKVEEEMKLYKKELPQLRKVNKVYKTLADQLKENDIVQNVCIEINSKRVYGLRVQVLPAPKDRRNFDPEKHGLMNEYDGVPIWYSVLKKPQNMHPVLIRPNSTIYHLSE